VGPSPLPKGKYRFRLLDWEFDKDKDGNIRNPKQPGVVLTLEVADGDYAGRKVRFLRVRSAPFKRGETTVSQLGDLIRAFDATTTYKGKAKFEALSRWQAEGATFEAKVDWRGFDMDHYRNVLAEEGFTSQDKTPEARLAKRKAGDAATIKGMARFPKTASGKHLPVTEGPSGAEVKAELEILDFVINKPAGAEASW
jgi:hypothetical protein